MNNKLFFILFLLSFFVYSQDEILRIETIDVFKEYTPKISTSTKISQQPTFNDTLIKNTYSFQDVTLYEINKKENLVVQFPSKFRFNNTNLNFNKYVLLQIGSHRYINTILHYNNGMSVKHNSGIYLKHFNEDVSLKSPYYSKSNGELVNSMQIYSTRYLNNDYVFLASLDLKRKSGLYWGQSDGVAISDIGTYIGKNFIIHSSLKRQAKESIFQSFDVGFDYLVNNYDRGDLLVNSFVDFEVKKALKKYYFSMELQLANSSMNNNLPATYVFLNEKISTNVLYSELSDFLIKSSIILSGAKLFDYSIGIDLQYAQLKDVGNTTVYDNKEIEQVVFPTLHILKNINTNQKIEFVFKKDLNYTSFNDLFTEIGYVDPYFRNSVSEEMEISLRYNKALSKKISFWNSINYCKINNKLIPFLFLDFSDDFTTNPLGLYGVVFRGINISSSASFNSDNYSLLMSSELNMLNSKEHEGKKLLPLFKLNSTLTVKLSDKLNLVSDWAYVGQRDGVRVSLYDYHIPYEYIYLNAYLNTSLALKYNFNNLIFSIDLKNILGQDLNFYDGYTDDDRLKLRFGFFYKF